MCRRRARLLPCKNKQRYSRIKRKFCKSFRAKDTFFNNTFLHLYMDCKTVDRHNFNEFPRTPLIKLSESNKTFRKLTLRRSGNTKVLQFLLFQLDVVLEQMHRAVAALRYVLQVCLRAAQLPRPRQAALQNFPVRDTLFVALLGFLIERLRHECRKFFHGRALSLSVVLLLGEIHREWSEHTAVAPLLRTDTLFYGGWQRR